jgi:uncharacterized SAM-binding protein YcdF (DUF218 family)
MSFPASHMAIATTGRCTRIQLIDYISPETEIQPCKFALMFGSRHAQADLSRVAIDLFHSGHFEMLIIAGGRTRGARSSEAREIFNRLVAQGLPRKRIILEETSSNTGENVRNARKLMKHAGISELLLIGKIYAKRRYAMTVKKQWPEITRLSCATIDYFGVAREQWWKSPSLRFRIFSEARKIEAYLERGFLTEVDVINRTFVLQGAATPAPGQRSGS